MPSPSGLKARQSTSLTPDASGAGDGRRSHVAPIAACFLLLAGFVPIGRLIPGGSGSPYYSEILAVWVSGSALVAGVAIVLAILSRRIAPLWRNDAWVDLTPALAARAGLTLPVIAALAFAMYAAVAVYVLAARPLFVDEIVQVLQARMYATGRLWTPVDALPEFFSLIHVVDGDGRFYGQFPVGGPTMLLPGVLLGVPWLTGPLFGALSVLLFAALVRRIEPRPTVTIGATLLFAFAPFTVFMSGSHMNHVTVLTWILVGVLGLARIVTAERAGWGWGVLCGLGFGVAAAIRPVDAFAFALPASAWLLARAVRDRRHWPVTLCAGAGVALPLIALMAANAATTGAPLLFAYEVLWGASHGLGFHVAPWGATHTPARGLELIGTYFFRLQTYLFELPIPSLLPAIGALTLVRRIGALDRYLIVCAALLSSLYFAYWHDGFYLGPRFLFPIVPIVALWTARLPALVRERTGSGSTAHRLTIYSMATAGLIGVLTMVPDRARQYQRGLLSMRWDVDRLAEEAGVRDGLVFVRESWGSQLISRLWALGITRSEAERFYSAIDLCALDGTLAEAEHERVSSDSLRDRLLALTADSGRTMPASFGLDSTGRMLPGAYYGTRCMRRVSDDMAGFTLLPPVLLASRGNNLYVRDLHERDSLMLARHPDRPVYLLRPPREGAGVEPRFFPLDRDSLMRAWRAPLPPDSGAYIRFSPVNVPPPVAAGSPDQGSPPRQ